MGLGLPVRGVYAGAETEAGLLRAPAALARSRDRLGQSRGEPFPVQLGNEDVGTRTLTSELGYVAGQPPRDRAFKRELEAELERMRVFLGINA